MTDATPKDLLRSWLRRSLDAQADSWLDRSIAAASKDDRRAFAIAMSMASRKIGKADLLLKQSDLESAQRARHGWDPSTWTADQAARTLLVLSLPANQPEDFVSTLDRLFSAADVGELVSLYQALPLLPFQENHRLRAAEGIRTNMRSVFEAVAHRNPYPSEQLDEGSWNQMVLKCLFIGSRLAPIVGLDGRANPALTSMLWDYSRERRAAHRDVSPELWRCIGPFADETMLKELGRLLHEGEPLEVQAAALSLASSSGSSAKSLLDSRSDAAPSIERGAWSWDAIAARLDEQA